MKTYHKNYTRDNALILQESWGIGFINGFEKSIGENNPAGAININYVHDGVVQIWDCKEAFDWFFDKLLEKNTKDPNFFKKSVETYNSLLKELEKYIGKKRLDSLDELKKFIDLIFRATQEFIIFYHSAMDERTPKDIKEKSIQMRNEDSYFDDGNRIIRDTLSSLYPRVKGMEIVITTADLDNIPENQELKKRMNNFVFIPNQVSEIIELKDFLKNNPDCNFVFDKITKETIEKGIIRGKIAYKGKAKGKVRIIRKKAKIKDLEQDEILVTYTTSPDFIPAIEKSAAIITDEGGLTCHAAIISREMKKPCIIGTKVATKIFKDGDIIEVDAEKGIVRKLN